MSKMRQALIELVRATRPSSNESLKPLPRQIYEMVGLRLFHGIGPRYYLVAGLNRTDVSTAAAFGHIDADKYRRFVRRTNPPEKRNPLNSKVEQKRRLIAAGIPTLPPIYAAEPGAADAAGLVTALTQHVDERVAVKPTSSFGGDGFRSFFVRAQGDAIALDDGQGDLLPPGELIVAMGGGLMVEPYLRQHPWYEAVNPTSVNTWRIWVIKLAGRKAEAILTYLRMGRAGSQVDNMTSGGLYAPLRANGTLGPAGDGSIFRREFPVHPDSKTQLENTRPPFIDEAIALAEQALDGIPALTFAGMDIAVAPDGPVVIEINAEPDRMGAARVGLPFRQWLADRGIRI